MPSKTSTASACAKGVAAQGQGQPPCSFERPVGFLLSIGWSAPGALSRFRSSGAGHQRRAVWRGGSPCARIRCGAAAVPAGCGRPAPPGTAGRCHRRSPTAPPVLVRRSACSATSAVAVVLLIKSQSAAHPPAGAGLDSSALRRFFWPAATGGTRTSPAARALGRQHRLERLSSDRRWSRAFFEAPAGHHPPIGSGHTSCRTARRSCLSAAGPARSATSGAARPRHRSGRSKACTSMWRGSIHSLSRFTVSPRPAPSMPLIRTTTAKSLVLEQIELHVEQSVRSRFDGPWSAFDRMMAQLGGFKHRPSPRKSPHRSAGPPARPARRFRCAAPAARGPAARSRRARPGAAGWRPAALGADQHRQRAAGRAFAGQRPGGARREDQARAIEGLGQIFGQRQDRRHLPAPGCAPTARRPPPRSAASGPPLVGPVAGELEHRTPGRHRLDRHRAQLDRLLDDPVHLVAARQRLHQRDLQRRFTLDRQPRPHADGPFCPSASRTAARTRRPGRRRGHRVATASRCTRSAWWATGPGRIMSESEEARRGRRSADSSCYYPQIPAPQRDGNEDMVSPPRPVRFRLVRPGFHPAGVDGQTHSLATCRGPGPAGDVHLQPLPLCEGRAAAHPARLP